MKQRESPSHGCFSLNPKCGVVDQEVSEAQGGSALQQWGDLRICALLALAVAGKWDCRTYKYTICACS